MKAIYALIASLVALQARVGEAVRDDSVVSPSIRSEANRLAASLERACAKVGVKVEFATLHTYAGNAHPQANPRAVWVVVDYLESVRESVAYRVPGMGVREGLPRLVPLTIAPEFEAPARKGGHPYAGDPDAHRADGTLRPVAEVEAIKELRALNAWECDVCFDTDEHTHSADTLAWARA